MTRLIASTQPPERRIVAGLFSLFLLHLLLYVWLVPPWQHYDEPTHFEYALLIRDLGRLPTIDEQIPELRRSIARSMINAGFFRNPNLPLTAPNPDSAELSLGVNERGHPPLYYTIVALGTLPFRTAPIDVQLRAARCVSVALAALLFLTGYWLLRLVTGECWGLRCAVLAALALQPAFIDNSSSVNSDVLANLVAVLVLLVAVRAGAMTKRRTANREPENREHRIQNIRAAVRLSTRQLVSLSASLLVIALAWNVKRTLLAYSLLIPLAWLVRAPRRVRRGLLGAVGVASMSIIAWLLLTPWTLADWQGSPAALVARPNTAFAGQSAFVVRGGEVLTQRIYPYRVLAAGTQSLTLTVRMRAEAPLTAWTTDDGRRTTAASIVSAHNSLTYRTRTLSSPILKIGTVAYSQPVTLDSSWRLVTVTATLANPRQTVEIQLPGSADGIMYDSLALVGGAGPTPTESEPDGAFEAGALGGELPRNMARNAGAERRVPPLPAPLVALLERRLGQEELGQLRSSLSNPQWIAAVYPRQFWLLFVGAWGVFGWGQYSVSAGWFTPLALLAAASVVGAVLGARSKKGVRGQESGFRNSIRLRREAEPIDGTAQWQSTDFIKPTPSSQFLAPSPSAWWLCAIAVLLGWGVALLRVHNQPFPGTMFWSFGRYTFVAIVPSLLLFIAGFRALFPPSLRNQATAAQIGFLAVFALVALAGLAAI